MVPRDGRWTYLKLYPGDLRRVEELVQELPVLATAAAGTDDQAAPHWFFVRFIDATGYHLRLRVRRRPGRPWRESLADVTDALARTPVPVAQVVPAFHAPEVVKFPSAEAVWHDEVFRRSSCLAAHLAGTPGASAVGALHRLYRRGSRIPAVAGPCFGYQCAWYWSDKSREFRIERAAGPARNVELLRRHEEELGGALRGEVDDLLDTLAGACEHVHNPWLTVFHHLHLSANRLGVLPPVEAAVAGTVHRELTGTSARELPGSARRELQETG